MKSTLIKDTSKADRMVFIKDWVESEGWVSSGIDVM